MSILTEKTHYYFQVKVTTTEPHVKSDNSNIVFHNSIPRKLHIYGIYFFKALTVFIIIIYILSYHLQVDLYTVTISWKALLCPSLFCLFG